MRKWWVYGVMLVILSVGLPVIAQDNSQGGGQGQSSGNQVSPYLAPQLFTSGYDDLNAGNNDKAILKLSTFILLNPTAGAAYALRGESYRQAGDPGSAIKDYRQATTLGLPNDQLTGAVYTSQAQAHLDQGDPDAAIADLTALIEATPTDPQAYVLRGSVYEQLEQYDKAEADYQKAIEVDPKSAAAYYALGNLYLSTQKYAQSVEAFGHVIDLAPDDARGYSGRARAYASEEKYAEALQDLNDAIRIDPKTPTLRLLRGFVNSALNKTAPAAQDFFDFMSLNRTKEVQQPAPAAGDTLDLAMDQGVIYAIPLDGKTDQQFSIRASSDSVVPMIVLLDPQGKPLVGSVFANGNGDALILQFPLPADGTYTVLVSHATGNPQGTVSVVMLLQ